MQPQFKSRADQLQYFFLLFIEHMNGVIEKSGGKTKIPIEQLRSVPAALVCGYANDIFQKYGDGLLKNDTTVLFRLVSEFSRESSMEAMSQEALAVCKYIEDNPATKDAFFKFVRVIHKLLQ